MISYKKKQLIKEIKITGTELVVQDNKLIDSPKMLNLQEQKLFLFLVSKIDSNNSENILFRIPIVEFAKAIGVDSKNDIYRDVRKAMKRLIGRIVSINKTEEGCKTTTDIPILSYAKYWHGKGFADIEISKDITPYLFSLHREFTQYKLAQITTLSSLYAIRIYEMLKKQEAFGKRTFFIDELREKLSIKQNKLKAFKDFRLYVLEIAKREINLKTDIKIDFEFIKAGKRVTAIQFDIVSENAQNKGRKNLFCINNRKDYRQIEEVAPPLASKITKVVGSKMENDDVKNSELTIPMVLKEKLNNKNNRTKIVKYILQKTGFMKIFQFFKK